MTRIMVFRDRTDAGRQLAARLADLELDSPVVVGMARGGVPVAFEVAKILNAPLYVIVVRKLGHPSQPELGMGAIAEGGVRVVNSPLVAQLGVPESLIDRVAQREGEELVRRLGAYRGDRPAVQIEGRTVVVVDDGLATGFTALAAVESLRKRGAKRVVLAVPVAPPGAVEALRASADDVVCVEVSERFFGISEWYADFHQVPDQEVVELLESAHASYDSATDLYRPTKETKEATGGGRGRHSPLRGAGRARAGGTARRGLVHGAFGDSPIGPL